MPACLPQNENITRGNQVYVFVGKFLHFPSLCCCYNVNKITNISDSGTPQYLEG